MYLIACSVYGINIQQALGSMFSKSLVHCLELLNSKSAQHCRFPRLCTKQFSLKHAHKYAVSAPGGAVACNWSDSVQTLQTKLTNLLMP